MAVRTFGEPIVEFSGESITTGTASVAKGIPPGTEEVIAYAATASRIQVGPKIGKCLKTTDSGTTFTDYTVQAQDRDTSTSVTLTSLDTAANGDYWYLGSKYKFSGCTIDVDSVNDQTATMVGYYWDGTAWGTASTTDGTDSGGVCLAVDGSITWAIPATWKRTTATDVSGLKSYPGLYFIRFQGNAALGTACTLDEIALLPEGTVAPYGYMAATTDYVFSVNPVETGSLAFYAASASTVSVSWLRHSKLGNT